MPVPNLEIHQLGSLDGHLARHLNSLFGRAFTDIETYAEHPPTDQYLRDLLAKKHVIVLVALSNNSVVGGLLAYELEKLEQARSEVYIYDLAVDAKHRRKGIATSLIGQLREIAAERKAWVMYVQADYVDPPAIGLYEKLGKREAVLHFEIAVAN